MINKREKSVQRFTF